MSLFFCFKLPLCISNDLIICQLRHSREALLFDNTKLFNSTKLVVLYLSFLCEKLWKIWNTEEKEPEKQEKLFTVWLSNLADFNSSIIVSIFPRWRFGVTLLSPPLLWSNRDGEDRFNRLVECLMDLVGDPLFGVEWSRWPFIEMLASSFSAVSRILRSTSKVSCLKTIC